MSQKLVKDIQIGDIILDQDGERMQVSGMRLSVHRSVNHIIDDTYPMMFNGYRVENGFMEHYTRSFGKRGEVKEVFDEF